MQLWKEKPLLRSPDAYIPAKSTARHLQGKIRILLVGDAWGRDWQYLTRLGKEVHVLDIAPQEGVPNLVVQSIEKATPFIDGFFEGVVINEVLEHLFHDVAALEEIHRILANDGVLVVTVPYISNVQDEPEVHVRVHTPRTIRRLLERCGFQIEEHFSRGFACHLPSYLLSRAVIYLCQKTIAVLLRKNPDDAVDIVNGSLDRVERFLGSNEATMWFQKLFTSYGGIMKARRVESRKNFDEVQLAQFSHKY